MKYETLFSILLAGCMLASVTAFASENTITPGGDGTTITGENVKSNSAGNTLVEYKTADESYTITIPTKITISSDGRVSGDSDTVTLSNVFLANGKVLNVTATALNSDSTAKNEDGFRLFLLADKSVAVPYTLQSKIGSGSFADVSNEGAILKNIKTQEDIGTQGEEDIAIATLKASIDSEYDFPAVGTYQANIRFTVTYTDEQAG